MTTARPKKFWRSLDGVDAHDAEEQAMG